MQILKLAIILTVIPVSAFAGQSVFNRANNVATKLEVLNEAGRTCDYKLSVDGLEGAKSKECQRYLKNIRGKYFKNIMNECVSLSKWYEQKRKFIISDRKYLENHPSEASELVRDMKSVNKACSTESLESYEYIKKPLDKINALQDMK